MRAVLNLGNWPTKTDMLLCPPRDKTLITKKNSKPGGGSLINDMHCYNSIRISSTQYHLDHRWERTRRVKLVSSMWRNFLSEIPFWCEVYEEYFRWIIPCSVRKDWKCAEVYSHFPSDSSCLMAEENWFFTGNLNLTKHSNTSNLYSKVDKTM